METEKLIEEIKNETGNSEDIIIKKVFVENKNLYIVFCETLSSSEVINDFILRKLSNLNSNQNSDLYKELLNQLPVGTVREITTLKDILKYLFNGFTIVIIDNFRYLAIETRATLDRGINTVENEVSIVGPKDAFTENFNKNIGLMRKRIRSNNLYLESINMGKQTNTKVGICYMKNIVDDKLIEEVKAKLNEINIDAVIDTGYIREKLLKKDNVFPVINTTERPDTATLALLEGKVCIIIDNTPYALIIPTFFTDLLHTPDDYYQKSINATFIRILRLLAFFISILLPAIYISVTTHNFSSIPINLLVNFTSQRQTVPFPAFFEAILMIICFEILRESDIRIPSKTGTSVSILGGLILGDAAVRAGIISPIMIIVIAISAISALVFTSTSLINAIRYYRLLTLLIATFFGIYGIFIGFTLLITQLSSLTSFGYPFMAPISPIIKDEIKDSVIKTSKHGVNKRNPILANKNIVRGR